MGSVVGHVAVDAGVDACVVEEEGLVATVGIAESAVSGVDALKTSGGAGQTPVLEGGSGAEEIGDCIGVGGLRAGQVAEVVGRVLVIATAWSVT